MSKVREQFLSLIIPCLRSTIYVFNSKDSAGRFEYSTQFAEYTSQLRFWEDALVQDTNAENNVKVGLGKWNGFAMVGLIDNVRLEHYAQQLT